MRQYRFLLRTAPLDALEEAHVEVLAPMARSRRAMVLRAVQDGLVAGLRLHPTTSDPLPTSSRWGSGAARVTS